MRREEETLGLMALEISDHLGDPIALLGAHGWSKPIHFSARKGQALPVTNEFLPLLGSYGFMLHLDVCLPGILWVHAILRCVFVRSGQQSELPFVLQVVPGPGRPAHLSYSVFRVCLFEKGPHCNSAWPPSLNS